MTTPISRLGLPLHGASRLVCDTSVTMPGSFALKADIGGPLMFASPDTPHMPAPSEKTAWDFMPEDWLVGVVDGAGDSTRSCSSSPCMACESVTFADCRGVVRTVTAPPGFTPITQLEHGRLGNVTPPMRRGGGRGAHSEGSF